MITDTLSAAKGAVTERVESLTADETGVSPVIGVILMVAITVILAAVIGTFVLGLGDQVKGSASAGVSVDTSVTLHKVTVVSMGSNTKSVACTGNNQKATSVGGTFGCPDGANIVAIGKGDTKNAVIKTNI